MDSKILSRIEFLDKLDILIPIGRTRVHLERRAAITEHDAAQRERIDELGAELEADPRMKMYTWGHVTRWLAVARARNSTRARELILGFDRIGESGDGSCPVRDEARKFVTNNQPTMWIGENAEFCLSDSSELEEQENHSRTLETEVQRLTAELATEREKYKTLDEFSNNVANALRDELGKAQEELTAARRLACTDEEYTEAWKAAQYLAPSRTGPGSNYNSDAIRQARALITCQNRANEYYSQLVAKGSELAALRVRLEAHEKDTARLEWLMRNRHKLLQVFPDKAVVWDQSNGLRCVGKGDTGRDAIDAAMSGEKTNE